MKGINLDIVFWIIIITVSIIFSYSWYIQSIPVYHIYTLSPTPEEFWDKCNTSCELYENSTMSNKSFYDPEYSLAGCYCENDLSAGWGYVLDSYYEGVEKL